MEAVTGTDSNKGGLKSVVFGESSAKDLAHNLNLWLHENKNPRIIYTTQSECMGVHNPHITLVIFYYLSE